MEIKSLVGIGHKDVLNVFNESFCDYLVPFQLTEELLKSKMMADYTDLELSVGVFDNQKLIAFILHGWDTIKNKKVVYNGGTGVIPSKRGNGLTKRMYLFSLPVLEKKGVDKIVLEVISQNIQAIKSYKKSGFTKTRELACFKGSFKPNRTNKNLEIKPLLAYPWKTMESFWDINPTWQNSKNVMNTLRTLNASFGAYLNNQLLGYLIYNPQNQRIQQIAVDKDFRKKGIASTLISNLAKEYGNTLSVINVDKKAKNMINFLNSIGLENYLEQFEMELDLTKN
ncbi:MAG: GNAT family N-acetyltransferase [Bacteroidota bacterium]